MNTMVLIAIKHVLNYAVKRKPSRHHYVPWVFTSTSIIILTVVLGWHHWKQLDVHAHLELRLFDWMGYRPDMMSSLLERSTRE